MNQIKKTIVLTIMLVTVATLAGCSLFPGKQLSPPTINGATDLTIEVDYTGVDWLENVTAKDSDNVDITDQIIVDYSAVDLTTIGTYTITYTVQDANNKPTSITVNVYVVPTSEQTFINLDTYLLTQLTGEDPDAQTLTLIEEAAQLRVQNYGVIYMLGMSNTERNIQDVFSFELTEQQMQLMQQYIGHWQNAFSNSEPTLSEFDVKEIMFSFMLGRHLKPSEQGIFSIVEDIEFEYNELRDYSEHSRFDEATIAEIENVLARALSADEVNIINAYTSMNNEMTGKYFTVMFSRQIQRQLVLEEIVRLQLIVPIIMRMQFDGDGLPTIQEIESYLGAPLTQEQLQAFETLEIIFGEYVYVMLLNEMQDNLDRELTVDEKQQLEVYAVIVMEYMSNYNYNEHPEFEDANVTVIESVIGRGLTTQELDALDILRALFVDIPA